MVGANYSTASDSVNSELHLLKKIFHSDALSDTNKTRATHEHEHRLLRSSQDFDRETWRRVDERARVLTDTTRLTVACRVSPSRFRAAPCARPGHPRRRASEHEARGDAARHP